MNLGTVSKLEPDDLNIWLGYKEVTVQADNRGIAIEVLVGKNEGFSIEYDTKLITCVNLKKKKNLSRLFSASENSSS